MKINVKQGGKAGRFVARVSAPVRSVGYALIDGVSYLTMRIEGVQASTYEVRFSEQDLKQIVEAYNRFKVYFAENQVVDINEKSAVIKKFS